MRRTLFLCPILALVALVLPGCARKDSAAEREAEINRRVEQRLAVAQQARERQALVQRAANVAQREHELAAREAFLADMAASILRESAPSPDSADDGFAEQPSALDAAPDDAFVANEPVYSDPYAYAAPNEPVFDSDALSAVPIAPPVTVINQTAALIYVNRRPARLRRDRNYGGTFPQSATMQPQMRSPKVTVAPRPTIAPPAVHHSKPPAAVTRPVVNPPQLTARTYSQPAPKKVIRPNPN